MIVSSNAGSWMTASYDPRAEDTALVAFGLNTILADELALYLKTKKFSCTVSGFGLHACFAMLDQQAARLLETADAMANRICALDACALRATDDAARHRFVVTSDAQQMSLKAMLAALFADNLNLASSLHALQTMVDDDRDPDTTTLIQTWTQDAERRAVALSAYESF